MVPLQQGMRIMYSVPGNVRIPIYEYSIIRAPLTAGVGLIGL